MQLQQGDVLLKPINIAIPKEAKRIKDQRGLVLSEGEVTGHCHAIKDTSDAELIQLGEKMLLQVNNPVDLTHQEHKTINVPPGLYEIGIVKEWDWAQEMTRNVVD